MGSDAAQRKYEHQQYESLVAEQDAAYKERLRLQKAEQQKAALEQRKRMDYRCLTLIGEYRPQVNACTLHEALVSALRFATAFQLDSPVSVGETSVKDLEMRIVYESQRLRKAWLCWDNTLSEKTIPEDVSWDFEQWKLLEGAHTPICQELYDAALSESQTPLPEPVAYYFEQDEDEHAAIED